jgi:hypothetical protein
MTVGLFNPSGVLMLKIVSAFLVTLLAAGSLMAQDIPLPGPGGPDDRLPIPPTVPSNRPPVPQPPSTGQLDPFPNQTPVPDQTPVPNDDAAIIYTLGSATTPRRGSLQYVFVPTSGYDMFRVVEVLGTGGVVQIESVTVNFNDGRPSVQHLEFNKKYRSGEDEIWFFLANHVASIVVIASNASGRNAGSFRIDVKATRSYPSH